MKSLESCVQPYASYSVNLCVEESSDINEKLLMINIMISLCSQGGGRATTSLAK